MKKIFFITLVSAGIIMGIPKISKAQECGQMIGFDVDFFGAVGRALSTAVKYFLSDDQELTAELVFDGAGGGSCSGGCGGAYTGDKGSAASPLNAVASSLTDIPAESGAYPDDIKVKENSVGKLADLRAKEILKGRVSLDELTEDNWAIEYRAQQRAIQAVTDALVMKKAYKELESIAKGVSSGSYSNYSEAASTVATRRLTLDALMALRKRVIAARVRARAETMEANIDISKVPSPAKIDETSLKDNTVSDKDAEVAGTQTAKTENGIPDSITDYGLKAESENTIEGGE